MCCDCIYGTASMKKVGFCAYSKTKENTKVVLDKTRVKKKKKSDKVTHSALLQHLFFSFFLLFEAIDYMK